MKGNLKTTLELLSEAQLQLSTEDIVKAGIDNHTACKFNGNLLSFYAVLDSGNREKLATYIYNKMELKILRIIANEIKEDAEEILECELILGKDDMITDGKNFLASAKFADNKARQTDSLSFLSYNNKKYFHKQIGEYEYFLGIEGLS